MITNIKLILLVIVFIIFNISLIEPLDVTYKWSFDSDPQLTPLQACGLTGLRNKTGCKFSEDSCWKDESTGILKNIGDVCRNSSGINGVCRNINNKMICNISNNDIIQQMSRDISNQVPATTNSGENYYTIVKDGESKTHAPSCNDSCDIDLSTVDNPNFCNNKQNCCLCSTDLWNNVYTSKKDDMLTGEIIEFGNLPLFDSINDKTGYSIIKLLDHLQGDITENKFIQGDTDNFKRYFDISGIDESKKYSPSKGFFFNQFNVLMDTEYNFPLSEYPNYIRSDVNSYMEDPFYYEECLYNKIADSCECSYNSIPNNNPIPPTEFKSNNPICTECQRGSVVRGGECVGCSQYNKVLSDSGDCVNCDVYCSGRNQIKCIYNDGQCYPIDSTDKTIRSDCLSTDGNIDLCNITAYGSKTGNNLYHLSNDTTNTLEEFYTACLSTDNCEVVQHLIDLNEGYINFNEELTNNTLNYDDPNVLQYNMVTNEFCKNITDSSACKQLKQCDWNNSYNKCFVNINYNKYYTDIFEGSNIMYHYIPIPPFDEETINPLSTECSGRIQDECIINCSWNQSDGTCLDICDTKLNSDDCLSVDNCNWDDTMNTCSRESIISCNPPNISIPGYSKIEDIPYGNKVSETNFNNNTKCTTLADNNLEDTSIINYSGYSKGFCFDGIDEIIPTGCIDSRKINDIQLHKNNDLINKIVQDTLNDEPNNVLLINNCNELCEINSNICDDYGVKFPTSLNNTDEGCYLLKSVNWKCSGTVINGVHAGLDCSEAPPVISGDLDWCERVDGNDPTSGGCYLEQINPICISTDNPPGCVPPPCTDVNTPEGCTPQYCTDVDIPYAGCIVPECTEPGVPYDGCLRTLCDENEYVEITEDGFRCTSCPQGQHNPAGDFIYDGVTTCDRNICICPNGTSATDTECLNNGDPKCVEPCDAGYYFDNNECLEKTCICPNGTPATGTECPNNGDPKCIEPCSQGYYFDNNQCLEKTCICNHGTAATNIDCEINGNSKCIDCTDGYYLYNERCLDNICSCTNGNSSTGPDCPSNGSEYCDSCYPGYGDSTNSPIEVSESERSCPLRECGCNNGTGATGTECSETGENICTSCNDGYHLDADNQCRENVCNCSDGTPATGAECPNHGGTKCVEPCSQGYNLNNDGICIENNCYCNNGYPSTHHESRLPRCPPPSITGEYTAIADEDGHVEFYTAEHCRYCFDGYHLENHKCVANVCTCDNGTGATGVECPTHNTARCAAPPSGQSGCNTNYYYSDGACYPQLDQGQACGSPGNDKRCKSYDSLGANACIECRSYWPSCHGGTSQRGYWCQ